MTPGWLQIYINFLLVQNYPIKNASVKFTGRVLLSLAMELLLPALPLLAPPTVALALLNK